MAFKFGLKTVLPFLWISFLFRFRIVSRRKVTEKKKKRKIKKFENVTKLSDHG